MHIVIKDSSLNGWEYGMLRSFENAIQEETGAVLENIPQYLYAKKYMHHFGHGMTKGKYRKYFPKQSWSPRGEIAWYILMGPENYKLDLYKNWDKNFKKKILYLYDTFPSQYPLIKRMCSNGRWDIMITSFNDAVEDLEKITGRKWHCVEQAADKYAFNPVPFEERLIHFSSYGRRYPLLHEAVKSFCKKKGLYYDYTTHDGRHPVVDSLELYQQYGWHLNHSLFTFSWPVELTNPVRAGHLKPITCRWFESLAAGTVVLGQKPGNEVFDSWLADNLVTEVNPHASPGDLEIALETIWETRRDLYGSAQALSMKVAGKITWNERVQRILSFL